MNIVYETGFFIDVKNLFSAPLNVKQEAMWVTSRKQQVMSEEFISKE